MSAYLETSFQSESMSAEPTASLVVAAGDERSG